LPLLRIAQEQSHTCACATNKPAGNDILVSMISSQRSGSPVRALFTRTRTAAGGPAFAGAAIRILIVDDIEAWHCIYVEVLRQHKNLEVVGIARNSVEAIQEARELKPDVILLDVGLGRADRLEAAQKIREVSPKSRVLLIGTAESTQLAVIAQSSGAYGYITKRNVVLELLPAVQALSRGRRFHSSAAS
jgi:CheY-like chemotaxis protein